MTDKRPGSINQVRYPEFGVQLRRARLQSGVIRPKLAESVRVQVSYIGRIECGLAMPSLSTFAALWRCLRFDVDALLAAIPEQAGAPETETKQAPFLWREVAAQSGKLGRVIARARVNAHITQQALADAIGVNRRQVARMESGHALPSLPQFAQLQRVLDLDAERVLCNLLGEVANEPFRDFGDLLRAARARASRSVAELAQALGCEPSHYRRLERGEVLPSIRDAAQIHQLIRYDANAAMRRLWVSGALYK